MSSFAASASCADNTLCSHELMQRAVTVMNAAIHESREQQATEAGLSLGRAISNGRTLHVRVVSAENLAERATFAISFHQDRVSVYPADDVPGVDGEVRVSEEHLQAVAESPADYLEEPTRMELLWMKERMTAGDSQHDQS